jgi:HlyD family secretion protein
VSSVNPACEPKAPARLEAISGLQMDRPVARLRWRRGSSKWLAWGVLAASACAGWMLLGREDEYRVAASTVELHTVVLREFEESIPVRGQVVPKSSTFVEVAAAGNVEVMLIEDGARVAIGQPLILLRIPAFELLTAERETALLQQFTIVLQAQAQLDRDRRASDQTLAEAAFQAQTARTELERQEMLGRSGFVSQGVLDGYRANSGFATDQYEVLLAGQARSRKLADRQEAQLRELAAGLQRTLANMREGLDALTIRAPAAGLLSGLVPKPGQRLEIGARVAQIDSEGDVKIVGTIDEFYLQRVAPGQSARASHEKAISLVVSKVLPQVSAGRITLEFGFERAMPIALRRGQTYELRLQLAAAAPALVLPNAPFLADSAGTYVYKLDRSGSVARKVAVRIGRKNPKWVEVLEGLAVDDRVVTSSYSLFKTYERLSITHG